MSEEKKEEILGKENELAADELEAVAGGDKCLCILGGAGESSSSDNTCGCAFGGAGAYKGGGNRCWCALGGNGESRDE